MAGNNLSSRATFLNNHVDVLTECSICHENFDHKEHAPARLTGLNSCRHVFGASCLKGWIMSDEPNANKCPMCRAVLYQGDGDTDMDVEEHEVSQVSGVGMAAQLESESESESEEEDEPNEGAESADEFGLAFLGACPMSSVHWGESPVYLEAARHGQAESFVVGLWAELWGMRYRNGSICDGEIEKAIHRALQGVDGHPLLWHKQYPGVMAVARAMPRQQYRIEPLRDLKVEELDSWVKKMSDAL